MISVLIETRNDEAELAHTLASLVPGAVEGVVREVIVCDRGSTDGTASVAEQAGCIFLPDASTESGVRAARGDWIMVLEPGARMASGWVEPVRDHISVSPLAAAFSRSSQTALPIWARLFRRRRKFAEGLLVPKPEFASAGRRPLRLRAEIHAAGN
jgi:glycosyltransferase involved in cell wall biosynthesis